MIEKVNSSHPDKVADRIAGALVDLAYAQTETPKIAVEVLIGHGVCHIIAETSVQLKQRDVKKAVKRIAGNVKVDFVQVTQDTHLAANQNGAIRCGDNGIFKGMPLTEEQKMLSFIVRDLYDQYPTDGKYILNNGRLIACQSNANTKELEDKISSAYTNDFVVNPLGDWTGGTNVDTGATNRKLGSDMADSVTGGGLHGKDLSKADVSVNIYAFLKAQETGSPVELCCAIGDETIDGQPYKEIVAIARKYINSVGGFEKFAEWGLY
jgi:S-adenosylmethionine synthetase